VPLLKAYQSYLKAEREISDLTIVNHLIVFSTKINESKIISLSFLSIEFPKLNITKSGALPLKISLFFKNSTITILLL